MLFVTLDSKEFCSTFPEDWCLMDLWRLWHALEMWYTHFCILAPYSKNWLFLTELLFSQQHFLLLVIVLRTCPYTLSWDGANHTYEFRISEASSINHVVKSSEQLWRQLTINSTYRIAFLVSESRLCKHNLLFLCFGRSHFCFHASIFGIYENWNTNFSSVFREFSIFLYMSKHSVILVVVSTMLN